MNEIKKKKETGKISNKKPCGIREKRKKI